MLEGHNGLIRITNEYRLCKKSNGELVLQRLCVECDEEKKFWTDIETVEEENKNER